MLAQSGALLSPSMESDTAEAILDAAEVLFPRQGFHGTSMRQVARFAGVTPAAIYNHFPSKEDLFVSLLKARMPHVRLAQALEQAEGSSAEALIRDGIRRMQRMMAGRAQALRLVFVEVLEFEGRHLPDVLPGILPPVLRFLERLRDSDPRLRAWPPLLLLRVIGGSFFAFVVSDSYLRGVEGLGGDLGDFEDLAAILAAGLLGASRRPPVEEAS